MRSESPARAPGRCVFFWDYDTQWGADRSRSGRVRTGIGALEFAHTERVLELHAAYSIPACFAVVGAAALPGERPYHDRAQIRRISDAGHEVASHSFQHEWLPGLDPDALRETLRRSRDILEQCTGRPVVTFVPPFNEPRDYPARLAVSLAERRSRPRGRVDLPGLCRAMAEAGYRSCRVAYQPLPVRALRAITGLPLEPTRAVTIEGVHCLRLNAGCGFGKDARRTLELCAREGGVAVLYAHPHSLGGDDTQNEAHLEDCLRRVARLRDEHGLLPSLPRDLVPGH